MQRATGAPPSSTTGTLKSLLIDGSLIGGKGNGSGIASGHIVESVTIGHDLIGAGPSAGAIVANNNIGSVLIGGDLIGAQDAATPAITFLSGSIFAMFGSIGSVTIGGSLASANIIAGINPGNDSLYGTGTGAVNGSSGHFAIEADVITEVKVGGIAYTHGTPAISFTTGFFLDSSHTLLVREI